MIATPEKLRRLVLCVSCREEKNRRVYVHEDILGLAHCFQYIKSTANIVRTELDKVVASCKSSKTRLEGFFF